MNFNKKVYSLYRGPDEAGVDKAGWNVNLKMTKVQYKDELDNKRGYIFNKKKTDFRSMRKFLERIGLL